MLEDKKRDWTSIRMEIENRKECLAKVLLLTKEEDVLIEDFICFYGELFGYENIVVVDNGSASSSSVHAVYAKYVHRGVEVRTDSRPFPSALEFMSEHMRSLVGSCTWILPLETDEFMFVIPKANDGGYVVNPSDIFSYLRGIPSDVSVIRYGEFWCSAVDSTRDSTYDRERGLYPRPTKDMVHFNEQGWDKVLVRASTFSHMVQWCHHAICLTGRMMKSDYLGLLHFHETGFRRKIESAVRVIESFGYIPNIKRPGEAQGLEEIRRSLAICERIASNGVTCGHKVEYYEVFLRRLLVLTLFRNILGRLPSDPNELDRYAKDKSGDAEAAIIRVSRSESTPPSSSSSWNALLFHDDAEPKEAQFEVPQVRTFFRAMDIEKPPTFEEVLNRYASCNNASGTDKTTSHAYGPLYSRLFAPIRGTVQTMLEIGVYSGASVQAFADFFADAAMIVGLDITLDCICFGRDDPRISLLKGDGTDPAFARKMGIPFDVILDDASHKGEDQVKAIEAFAPFLNPGGLFVIEDIAGNQDLVKLREDMERAAAAGGLATPCEWYDLRYVNGQFDDIVAVFRK